MNMEAKGFLIADDGASVLPHLSSMGTGDVTSINPVKTAVLLQKISSLRAENPLLDFAKLGETPWNILLELMASNTGARSLSVANLAIILDMPARTMKRYVDYLQEIGLIDMQRDEQKPADVTLMLTERGKNALSNTLARIAEQLNIFKR